MAHILVIEDEQELARLIASTLQSDGHTVEVLRDGQFAMDRINDASAKEPDLYILDLTALTGLLYFALDPSLKRVRRSS